MLKKKSDPIFYALKIYIYIRVIYDPGLFRITYFCGFNYAKLPKNGKKKKKLKKIFLDASRIVSKSQKIHFETNLLQKDLFYNNKNLNVLLLIN